MSAKILIVDDDVATRCGLAELLEAHGYETIAVGTLKEALDVLRKAPPNLLIADIRLGEFNGLRLLMADWHSVPAIIITGFADPVLESDARRAGAEYMVKPIDPGRFLTLVAQRLAGTGGEWPRLPAAT